MSMSVEKAPRGEGLGRVRTAELQHLLEPPRCLGFSDRFAWHHRTSPGAQTWSSSASGLAAAALLPLHMPLCTQTHIHTHECLHKHTFTSNTHKHIIDVDPCTHIHIHAHPCGCMQRTCAYLCTYPNTYILLQIYTRKHAHI